MEIRTAVLKSIESVAGSWTVVAAHLGMSVNVLRNRAYETKGWTLSTEHKLALQELSGQTFIVEAFCAASGGTFKKMPMGGVVDKESTQRAFNELTCEVSKTWMSFMAAMEDGVIDSVERASLEAHGDELHRVVQGLMARIEMTKSPQARVLNAGVVHG